jgi:hypothetical protein
MRRATLLRSMGGDTDGAWSWLPGVTCGTPLQLTHEGDDIRLLLGRELQLQHEREEQVGRLGAPRGPPKYGATTHVHHAVGAIAVGIDTAGLGHLWLGPLSRCPHRRSAHPSPRRMRRRSPWRCVDKILAVERRHADARLHAIAFGQVFEPNPGADVRPGETSLAHDGLGAVAGPVQPLN